MTSLEGAIALMRERSRLQTKLDKLWDWLEVNPHHSKHEHRHNVWMTTLHAYIRAEDNLRYAKEQLNG